MAWPVDWPAAANILSVDPSVKLLAERYAGACMSALTLHRVGGNPVTIMPAHSQRVTGHWLSWDAAGYPLFGFYPGVVYPSAADLHVPALLAVQTEAIELPGPVSNVTAVTVGGAVLDPAAYRVEDGRWLVRVDGGSWPGQGDGFTVTYTNSHPVDELGAHAAGVMAYEWLKLITRSKEKCRLPSNATSVSRAGITIEVASGMFPEGVTGMPEIDAYLMLWNPFGLKVPPRVYSPDLPRHRQVWSA